MDTNLFALVLVVILVSLIIKGQFAVGMAKVSAK